MKRSTIFVQDAHRFGSGIFPLAGGRQHLRYVRMMLIEATLGGCGLVGVATLLLQLLR